MQNAFKLKFHIAIGKIQFDEYFDCPVQLGTQTVLC